MLALGIGWLARQAPPPRALRETAAPVNAPRARATPRPAAVGDTTGSRSASSPAVAASPRPAAKAGKLPPPATPAAAYATADTLVVRGRVTDPAGLGLPGALVTAPALALKAVTGADGRYALTFPAVRLAGEDRMDVRAARIGMEPATRSLALREDSAAANFRLAPATLALEGLVLTGVGA